MDLFNLKLSLLRCVFISRSISFILNVSQGNLSIADKIGTSKWKCISHGRKYALKIPANFFFHGGEKVIKLTKKQNNKNCLKFNI